MSSKSESEHIVELAGEILNDIELNRLESDKLLLKCSRLARLAGSDEIKRWIGFEMQGFNSTDPVSILYMSKTGRWTDRKENKGYWGPLAQHEETILAQRARLDASKLSSLSGEYANATRINLGREQSSISGTISKLAGVRSRVVGLLHSFVSGIYYERQFANLAENTFETYKRDVDALIAKHAGDVLSKIPSVVERLKEGDPEAVSQALSTCRRILETFADAVYPPTDETIELGGNTIRLDASKHQNRINAYVAIHTESSTRRTRIRQNLRNLFDRVSTGVHDDVTSEEAFSLFLNAYLFLGEVLHLSSSKEPETASAIPTIVAEEEPNALKTEV
ncbi:hypothetical protein [Ahrensia sp. R2A130]|uniref:AbiTii domain-containing protein n=1 Tax=Ahrensia sp. R2A130 TaxID=744979 RepID=UPI0001E0D15C|nr:hypothetical protein [Ahrensia sp. R2A130]EFL87693.1 hypothetical protein R2A130_2843 [Ahrensia sp. R2A130]